MHASALDRRPRRDLVLVVLALSASVGAHVALAEGMSRIEPPPPVEETTWVEMDVREVTEPPPSPEPPPPPAPPEPEPPKPPPPPPPEPEVVEYTETTPEEAPTPPPPEPRRIARPIQGLSATSFAEGGASFTVRAGNTTAIAAQGEPVDPEDVGEFVTVPYASTTVTPRLIRRPVLNVPDELVELEIQGRVEVELTIDAEGRVRDVVILSRLHPIADTACTRDVRSSRWKPGMKDGTPVVVQGVPFSCRYEMAPE